MVPITGCKLPLKEVMNSLWPKANPREIQKGSIISHCTQQQRNKDLRLEVRDRRWGLGEAPVSICYSPPLGCSDPFTFCVKFVPSGKASLGFWVISFPEESYTGKVSGKVSNSWCCN